MLGDKAIIVSHLFEKAVHADVVNHIAESLGVEAKGFAEIGFRRVGGLVQVQHGGRFEHHAQEPVGGQGVDLSSAEVARLGQACGLGLNRLVLKNL